MLVRGLNFCVAYDSTYIFVKIYSVTICRFSKNTKHHGNILLYDISSNERFDIDKKAAQIQL